MNNYTIKELASVEENEEPEAPPNENTDKKEIEKEDKEREEEIKMRKAGIIAAANELLKNSRQYLEKVVSYKFDIKIQPGKRHTQKV